MGLVNVEARRTPRIGTGTSNPETPERLKDEEGKQGCKHAAG
jgi:hypothetical protein